MLAISVSTLEALLATTEDGLPVIYMDWLFFEAYRPEILHILRSHGYRWADFHARNGVFYAKDVDPKQYYVADPCKLY